MEIKEIARNITMYKHKDFILVDYPHMSEIEFRALMRNYNKIINQSRFRNTTRGGYISKPTFSLKERKHIMLSVKALADRGHIKYVTKDYHGNVTIR